MDDSFKRTVLLVLILLFNYFFSYLTKCWRRLKKNCFNSFTKCGMATVEMLITLQQTCCTIRLSVDPDLCYSQIFADIFTSTSFDRTILCFSFLNAYISRRNDDNGCLQGSHRAKTSSKMPETKVRMSYFQVSYMVVLFV